MPSSKNNSQKCLESAAAAARHIGSSGKPVQERHRGDRNSDYEGSTAKHVAKEEDYFQFDLRIQGVSQDAVYKDQERMTKVQNLVEKLQAGYQNKSIINDLWNPIRSAKHQGAQSKNWEKLGFTSWERFPKQFNAQRA